MTMHRSCDLPGRRQWLCALAWAGLARPASADRKPALPGPDTWEPLDEIGGVATWFRKLSAEFDRYVEKEKRAQLWRGVDKLRKALYQLEQDSLALRDLIPEATPTEQERAALIQQTSSLMQTVRRLSESLREIGADLRLSDPDEMWRVEERIFYGFRTRAVTLSYIQREVQRSREGGPWDAPAMRERLDKGIAAIRDAQKAVVAFHSQLGA
jgi:hypothetical protein